VADGEEALAFLRRRGAFADAPTPDLVLLDLNMPRKDGREVIAEIKGSEDLRRIPIIVLTTSDSEVDVRTSYQLNANCYIVKPMGLEDYVRIAKRIEDFWLDLVRLPQG
jgi:CheY-like chemotaxis protein